MRVIAGAARGHRRGGPPGAGTRPTSDKVKGAIFSMLETLLAAIASQPVGEGPEIRPEDHPPEESAPAESVWAGRRVLDLYAGTGALGIEALSRGAARADFVDASPECQRLIRENLRTTRLADRARVIAGSVQRMLARPREHGLDSYHVALLDAPYGDPTLEPTLEVLAASGLLEPLALVVVEHSRRGQPAEAYEGLRLIKRRRHGDTEVSIYLHQNASTVEA